jgi:hypothetical protein
MALSEQTRVDNIEITELNIIHVRTVTIIERDGVEISRSNHRHFIVPGQDYSNEDSKVQLIASTLWTQEVIDNYLEATAEERRVREAMITMNQQP